MKISKIEALICLLSVGFLTFTAGWFLRGERSAKPLRVEAQRTPVAVPTSIPSSPPTSAPTTVDTGPAEDISSVDHTDDPESNRDAAPVGKVNLNTATVEELQTLPGIGEKRAADIVADREVNGPFRTPEDLVRVKGIGEATLAKLMDSITVSEEEVP